MTQLQNLGFWVSENLKKAHEQGARAYNKKHRHDAFIVRDQVLVRNRVLPNAVRHFAAKLPDKYKGPYKVAKVLSPLVYRLADPVGHMPKIYIRDLKPFHALT